MPVKLLISVKKKKMHPSCRSDRYTVPSECLLLDLHLLQENPPTQCHTVSVCTRRALGWGTGSCPTV